MKQIKIFIGFISLFLLFGCSVSTEFFIQNLTSSKQIIKINFREKIPNYPEQDTYGWLGFNYINEIVKPEYFIKNKNLKSLKKTFVKDSAISVELPAFSTTRIVKSKNYNWQSRLQSIEIQNQKYTIKDLEKRAKKIKYDYIYQIE
ncbi:hypothetical protein [Chryseobacterium sp. Leaf394]|uniref:hypothetical protein n=1 Tax=Chryseobacterium sp. Leaf394 TaxID=1736361 RepID=UPI0006FB73DF|nr:hypothetical protein [Chryseobacterium sp. Leaf394]KQS91745.1 hypothetical protein ASG21_04595 [Chryseobacterium sp. Leaf394]